MHRSNLEFWKLSIKVIHKIKSHRIKISLCKLYIYLTFIIVGENFYLIFCIWSWSNDLYIKIINGSFFLKFSHVLYFPYIWLLCFCDFKYHFFKQNIIFMVKYFYNMIVWLLKLNIIHRISVFFHHNNNFN